MNAYQMYMDSWEEFKKAKLSTAHDVKKELSGLAKKLVGVKRWKHALVKLPADGAKMVIGAAGFGATAATGIPLISTVLGKLTDPAVDKLAEMLIESWSKSDADVKGKTDLKTGFDYKSNKNGHEALSDLPKHIAQLVSAHQAYYAQCERVAKKMIEAKAKGVSTDEVNDILKSLFLSFHAMRWAMIKVARDASAAKAAITQVEALINESKTWMGEEGTRMIQATAPYFTESGD